MDVKGEDDVDKAIESITRSLDGYTRAVDSADSASERLEGEIKGVSDASMKAASSVKTAQDKLNRSFEQIMKNQTASALLTSKDAAAKRVLKAQLIGLKDEQRKYKDELKEAQKEVKLLARDETRLSKAQSKAAAELAKQAAELAKRADEEAKRKAAKKAGIPLGLDLIDEIKDISEQAGIDRARLKSRDYVKALRAATKAQDKLNFASKGFVERSKDFVEMGGNLEHFTSLLGTVTGAAELFWETMKAGAERRDVEAALSRLEGAATSAQIRGATGGITSGAAAGRIAARGADVGLTAAQSTQIAGLAKVAAQRKFITEGGDLKELTVQFSKQLQDELRAGKLGAAFEAVGVGAERFEASLREEAKIRGVGVENLSVYAREQILLNQAQEDGARTAVLFRTTFSDGMASTEAALANFRDSIGATISELAQGGAAPGGTVAGVDIDAAAARALDIAGSVQRQFGVEKSEEIIKALAQSEKGVELGTALIGAINLEQRANIERSAAVAKGFEENLPRLIEDAIQRGDTELINRIEGGLQDIIDRGDLQISTEGALEDPVGFAQSVESIRSAQKLANEETATRRDLVAFVGAERAKELATTLRSVDAERLLATVGASTFAASKKNAAARLSFLQTELQLNDTLSLSERTKKEIEIIEQESLVAQHARSANMEQLNKLIDSEKAKRLLTLRQDAKKLELEAELNTTLTRQERERLKTLAAAKRLEEQTLRNVENVDDMGDALARAAIGKFFDNGSASAKLLEGTLGTFPGLLSGATDFAAGFVAELDKATGAGILASESLAGLFEAPKAAAAPAEEKRRRGGGGRGRDRAELLARAERVGLSELEERRRDIEEQFKKDLKTARKVESLVAAATKIHTDAIANLLEERIAGLAARGAAAADTLAGFVGGVTDQFKEQQELVSQIKDSLASDEDRQISQLSDQMNARLELVSGNLEAEIFVRLDHARQLGEIEDARAAQEAENLQLAQEKREEDQRARELERQKRFAAFDEVRAMTDELAGEFSGDNVDQRAAMLLGAADALLISGSAVDRLMTDLGAVAQSLADNEITAAQATLRTVSGALSAAGAITGGTIKNVKTRAKVLGALESALALASFAELNIPGGIAHTAAAVKFFSLAGGGAGTVEPAKDARKQTRERNRRTSLSRTTLPSDNRFGGQQQINMNFFSSLDARPPGEIVVDAANAVAREGRGVGFDGALFESQTRRSGL
jgi:colicin import membrane protein